MNHNNSQLINLNTDFALSNFLFGSVKLIKTADRNRYNYTGYGIRYCSCSEKEKMSLILELI